VQSVQRRNYRVWRIRALSFQQWACPLPTHLRPAECLHLDRLAMPVGASPVGELGGHLSKLKPPDAADNGQQEAEDQQPVGGGAILAVPPAVLLGTTDTGEGK